MFYYTYNNEEDLYIHSQDPFRNKKRKKKYYTTLHPQGSSTHKE